MIDAPGFQQSLQLLQGVIGQGHPAFGLTVGERHLAGEAVFLPNQPFQSLDVGIPIGLGASARLSGEDGLGVVHPLGEDLDRPGPTNGQAGQLDLVALGQRQ